MEENHQHHYRHFMAQEASSQYTVNQVTTPFSHCPRIMQHRWWYSLTSAARVGIRMAAEVVQAHAPNSTSHNLLGFKGGR